MVYCISSNIHRENPHEQRESRAVYESGRNDVSVRQDLVDCVLNGLNTPVGIIDTCKQPLIGANCVLWIENRREEGMAGFRGPLMVKSAASAKSKFLSLS